MSPVPDDNKYDFNNVDDLAMDWNDQNQINDCHQ